MDPKTFLASVKLQQFYRHLEEGADLLMEGLWDAPKALLATLAAETTKQHVLFITSSKEESRLIEDLTFFLGREPVDLPMKDDSEDNMGARLKALQTIGESQRHEVVVCSLQAALQRVWQKDLFIRSLLSLTVGSEHPNLADKLAKMGYEQVSIVTDKGQFATRGCIIDLYPLSTCEPFRIESAFERIISIRAFDPASQRSQRKETSLQVLPAKEEESTSFLTYLGSNTLVIFDDLLALEEKSQSKDFHTFFTLSEHLQKCYLPKEPIEKLSEVQHQKEKIFFSCFGQELSAIRVRSPFLLLEQPQECSRLFVICPTNNDWRSFQTEHPDLQASCVQGHLTSSFFLADCLVGVLAVSNFQIRRQMHRRHYHQEVSSELLDLQAGDLVVHFHHGIGKYLGIEKQKNHTGITSEFLVVEYSERSKLFVPIAQSYLLSKYVGASDTLPTLHDLNSNRWKTLRTKTESSILGYAKDLLTLYAKRAHANGYACAQDSHETHLFEGDFPYPLTADQEEAMRCVKGDMTSSKCMDRLICGDVGYGKTEVAMRAAFKAVRDGKKQVAVLVPTTVLALQHYENFSERMRNFPIRIALLSRMRSAKERVAILKELQEGSIDIIIATHRILSKDVLFQSLGLVIIDEEQRFGVKAKEHLKTLTAEVDCLTLSATPIPRTLYMSLVGARDMSIIATPPHDRVPVKTIVCEAEEALIKDALLKELARGGQSYILHNRVETILDAYTRIKALVPEARILTAHGQMEAEEIDHLFHTFKEGMADILIATTIIENGVDIPNANTILVERADSFGLADLYQIRGRVGRWNKRAYCYFLTPPRRVVSEVAKKRLDILAQSSGFGAGMRIAMRDLELRGAGNLLGIEQSGHVATIGFHLYCKLLKRTVEALQGKKPLTYVEVKMEFSQDARFPEEYVPAVSLRLELYQRLGELSSTEEVNSFFEEVVDRFGPLPIAAQWLQTFSRLRIRLQELFVTLIRAGRVSLYLERKVSGRLVVHTLPFVAPTEPQAFEEKVGALLVRIN